MAPVKVVFLQLNARWTNDQFSDVDAGWLAMLSVSADFAHAQFAPRDSPEEDVIQPDESSTCTIG